MNEISLLKFIIVVVQCHDKNNKQRKEVFSSVSPVITWLFPRKIEMSMNTMANNNGENIKAQNVIELQ